MTVGPDFQTETPAGRDTGFDVRGRLATLQMQQSPSARCHFERERKGQQCQSLLQTKQSTNSGCKRNEEADPTRGCTFGHSRQRLGGFNSCHLWYGRFRGRPRLSARCQGLGDDHLCRTR